MSTTESNADQVEKTKRAIDNLEESLKFCERAIKSENRVELAHDTLLELSDKIERIVAERELSPEQAGHIEKLTQRAKILLYRARVLLQVQDKEQEKFLYRRAGEQK